MYLACLVTHSDLNEFCLQHRFTCRSLEYNYVTLQCHLSDSDRRTTGQYVQFVDAPGVDYFENLCLKGKIQTYYIITAIDGYTCVFLSEHKTRIFVLIHHLKIINSELQLHIGTFLKTEDCKRWGRGGGGGHFIFW